MKFNQSSKVAEIRGVELKWFGQNEPKGFTSKYDSWRYIPTQQMAKSDKIINSILDMRLPLTFSIEDCKLVAAIICQEIELIWLRKNVVFIVNLEKSNFN